MQKPFQITPLSPAIGAELGGIDLNRLDPDICRALQDALTEHLVLFFRDQDIPVETQIALGAWFGELDVHPNDPGLDGHPEVMVIHADETSRRVTGEQWHSDVSCAERPPMGSILRLHTVPECGGDTLFASMYAAWDALSAPMKELLGGLTAVHDGAPYYHGVNRIIGRDDQGKVYPRAEHPVALTHPVSGRTALFVNSMFTTQIVGLPRSESDTLLAMLFRHIEQPRFQCRFRWRKNSMAFWDNRCVQHQAIRDYWPETRSGYRVTIRGQGPNEGR